MRLINAETKQFEIFNDERKLPSYAILSHRWVDGHEIMYKDFLKGRNLNLSGREKIDQCCLQALEDGISYVWVDTCCIDKKSSAELSEAINSMYRWYGAATVCYAYLNDVISGRNWEQLFVKSSWFTRSWTLQEMLAPASIKFFDASWHFLGEKSTLSEELAEASGVHLSVFSSKKLNLVDWSVAQRMSWASEREATRVEDVAYSLLGIFGINMPLLYGEGSRAFRRLQEEIIRDRHDHTILAWSSRHENSCDLLASSPAAFAKDANVTMRDFQDAKAYSLTNLGLSIELSLEIWLPRIYWAGLNATDNGLDQLGVWLLKDDIRGHTFSRVSIPHSLFAPGTQCDMSGLHVLRRSATRKCQPTHLNIVVEQKVPFTIPALGTRISTLRDDPPSFVSFFISRMHVEGFDLGRFWRADLDNCPPQLFMKEILSRLNSPSGLILNLQNYEGVSPVFGIRYVSYTRPCTGNGFDIIFPPGNLGIGILRFGLDREMHPTFLLAEASHIKKTNIPLTWADALRKVSEHSRNESLLGKDIWQCDGLEDLGWLAPSQYPLMPLDGMSEGLWALKGTGEHVDVFLIHLRSFLGRFVKIIVERQRKDRYEYIVSIEEGMHRPADETRYIR